MCNIINTLIGELDNAKSTKERSRVNRGRSANETVSVHAKSTSKEKKEAGRTN